MRTLLRIGLAGGPAVIPDHKRIQVTVVEHRLDVAGLHARTQVLDHLIRVEHVAANLVAKPDRGLGPADLLERLGTLLELDLVQTGLENLLGKCVTRTAESVVLTP